MILIALALSAEPAAYPEVATLALSGPVALELPAAVVAGDFDALDQALRFEDATGTERAFAVLTSRQHGEGVTQNLEWSPVEYGDNGLTYEIKETPLPIDEVVISVTNFGSGPLKAALLVAKDDGWETVGADQFLWEYQGTDGVVSRRDTITLPALRGPFRLKLEGESAARVSTLVGVSYVGTAVRPVAETLPVSAPVLTEAGNYRYTITLPGPRAVSGLDIDAQENVFDRRVTVSINPGEYGEARMLRRAQIGAARLDDTWLRGLDLVGDRLVLEIPADRGGPLAIGPVTVYSVGAVLLAEAAGPAPQKLYFGGTEPDIAGDLGVAASEIARLAIRTPATTVVPEPNAAYVPRPTREQLDRPGPVVNTALWRWERAITGTPGWVSVALDSNVLARARPGLGDLRIVDSAGKGIPYQLRMQATETELALGSPAVEQEGRYTLISVAIPPGSGPVVRVAMATDATLFARYVELVVDRGTLTQTLRTVDWRGNGRPMVMEVTEELGDTLMLRINNGDDPPLPITSVRAWTVAHEVRFRLPESGARLIYGNRKASPPEFDLSLLGADLGRIRTSPATLGPESASVGVPMSFFDSMVVGASMLSLACGLVSLTVGALLRKAPSTEPAAESAPPSE